MTDLSGCTHDKKYCGCEYAEADNRRIRVANELLEVRNRLADSERKREALQAVVEALKAMVEPEAWLADWAKDRWVREIERILAALAAGTTPFAPAQQQEQRTYTLEEAQDSLSRLVGAAFNDGSKERPRLSIPANVDRDDDIIACGYVTQTAASLARCEQRLREAEALLTAPNRCTDPEWHVSVRAFLTETRP